MLSLAIGLVPLCHHLGSSHLLGVFLAGFCFCTADLVHAAWSKQVDLAGYCRVHLLGAYHLMLCTPHAACTQLIAGTAQVKRVLHWLLKIFFAASIGFVVPVRDFGDLTVIGNACILFIAVLGKLHR